MRVKAGYGVLFSLIVLIVTTGVAAAPLEEARPISPGGARDFPQIETRCPTFSWTAVEEAGGYELVVYKLPERDTVLTDRRSPNDRLEGALRLFRLQLPGRATSWTPAGDHCFDPAERYAWAVRGWQENRQAQWSEPHLFAVADLPTAQEVKEALSVLEKFIGETGGIASLSGFPIAGLADTSVRSTASLPGPIPTIDSVAISAELTDTLNATAGIKARSNSANGIAAVLQNAGNGQIVSFQNSSNEVASVAADGTISAAMFVGDGSALTNLPGDGGAQAVAVFESTSSIAGEGTILSKMITAPAGGCRLLATATVGLKFDDLATQTSFDDPNCELRIGGTPLSGSNMAVEVDPFHRFDVCVSTAGKDLAAGPHNIQFVLDVDTDPDDPDNPTDPATADSATLTAVCIP